LNVKIQEQILSQTYLLSDHEKIQMSGPAEKNLVLIEKKYKVKILTRPLGLIVQSTGKEQLRLAIEALDRLKKVARSGQDISDNHFQNFITNHHHQTSYSKNSLQEVYIQNPILMDRYGKPVQPRTEGQAEFIDSVLKSNITLATGPAGTGKTYLAMALAVSAFKQKKISKIILVRPAVESGEHLGFLPGDMEEKIAPYMTPLYDAVHMLLGREDVKELTSNNEFEIAPLAYMRGRTLNNSFILLDEAQNTTIPQMKMFLTRIGVGSTVVVAGDETQIDLPKKILYQGFNMPVRF